MYWVMCHSLKTHCRRCRVFVISRLPSFCINWSITQRTKRPSRQQRNRKLHDGSNAVARFSTLSSDYLITCNECDVQIFLQTQLLVDSTHVAAAVLVIVSTTTRITSHSQSPASVKQIRQNVTISVITAATDDRVICLRAIANAHGRSNACLSTMLPACLLSIARRSAHRTVYVMYVPSRSAGRHRQRSGRLASTGANSR